MKNRDSHSSILLQPYDGAEFVHQTNAAMVIGASDSCIDTSKSFCALRETTTGIDVSAGITFGTSVHDQNSVNQTRSLYKVIVRL